MSRKGNGPKTKARFGVRWDNAVVESLQTQCRTSSGLLKTLKTELVYHTDYLTKKQARLSVLEYIEGWYNRKRRHSALGNKNPDHYQNHLEAIRIAS